jgi:hypothetical protein
VCKKIEPWKRDVTSGVATGGKNLKQNGGRKGAKIIAKEIEKTQNILSGKR